MPGEKKKLSPDRLTYHHSLAIKAGEKFMKALIEENFPHDVLDQWIKDWVKQAKKKTGIGPIEFLSGKGEIEESKILAWGARLSGTPIIDTEHVNAGNQRHYVIDGMPMTLLTDTDYGSVTLVHCLPFLDQFLDQKLVADIYGAIKVNYTLAAPINFYKHLERLHSTGKAVNRILARAEEEKNLSFSNQISSLIAMALLPTDFNKDAKREEILKAMEEKRPKAGAQGEVEWYSLTQGVPYVNLASISSTKELLEIVLPNTQKQYGIVPICEYGGTLTVASRRALRSSVKQELVSQLQKHCKINTVLGSSRAINDITTANLSAVISTTSISNQIKLESTPEAEDVEEIDISELAEGSDASVIKLVQSILIGAVNKRATDVHIATHPNRTWVRYRIDGNMVEAPFHLPFEFWKAVLSRIKIMSSIDIKYSPTPQDGKFPLAVGPDEYDIRVNTCPTVYGEKAVLRLQRKDENVPTLESLGLYPHEKKLITDVVEGDHGLLVICGPTGSGKTTTLSATMYAIDRKRWNVITAENPVEIRIPHVEQTPIDGSQLTFAKFVPAALRQDPDYIMIGETRDKETTEEVIRAAITGHIVMTTLHTNSAAGAPGRLIDMGGQPFLITDALKTVCAQRLIRRLCPNCSRPVRKLPTKEELDRMSINPKWLETAEYILEPVGCKLCNNTGYKGRVAIVEGYFTSPEIRRIIIHDNADTEKIRREIENQGGKTLFQHAVEHVARGTTSITEALTVRTLDG
jgi:type IV pilus assembly protein PilB